MRCACLVLITSFVLVAGAPARAVPPEPAAAGFRPERLARWRQAMDSTHAPALAVVAVRDTGVVALALLGARDVERALPVTPRTRFYIASCTKTFTAAAMWSLAAEGRLRMDDPVRAAWPAFRIADAGLTDSITVRELLAHRWGLHSSPLSFLTANTGDMDDARFARLLAHVESPRRFRYTNLHYLIAGQVIRARTGRPWAEVVAERVFGPAGMTRAAIRAAGLYDDPDAAMPCRWADGRFLPAQRKTDRTLHAAGGTGASIADLAQWLQLQLGGTTGDGRRPIPAATLRAMREIVVTVPDRHPLREDQERIGWAAGWEVRTVGGDTMFVHTGSFSGAAAHMSFVPARNLGVAVLTNVNLPPLTELVAAEVYDAMAGVESPDVLVRVTTMMERMRVSDPPDSLRGAPAHALADHVGRYEHPDWGALDVVLRGGALDMRMGDLPLPLVWLRGDRFIADGDTPGRFEFGAGHRAGAVFLELSGPEGIRFERR